MRKINIIIFLILATLFFIAYRYRDNFKEKPEEQFVTKAIVPTNENQTTNHDEQILSLFPLYADETLINTLSVDINNDTFQDQINEVKRNGSSNIFLIIGIYNPDEDIYKRATEIDTGISQTKTFLYTSMDLTGERYNALVFSGIDEKGNSVLKAFESFSQDTGRFNLTPIANFITEGNIFIQEVYRSESYSLEMTNGQSFPIWIYSSDPNSRQGSLDQIQTKYDWDKNQKRYIKIAETKVSGKKVEEKELSRIQDGKTKTFEKFLHGLWYCKSNSGENIRYLFFDAEKNEIIFLIDEIQEIYTWDLSSLRKNGIYISATNFSITNLVRRLNISLLGLDEIYLQATEDVKMLINEDNQWNGSYKKMSFTTGLNLQNSKEQKVEMLKNKLMTVNQNWSFDSNTDVLFTDSTFSIIGDDINQNGYISYITIKGTPLIQFRSESQGIFGSHYYKVDVEQTDDSNKRTETAVFTSVNITLSDFYTTNEKPVILTRVLNKNQE